MLDEQAAQNHLVDILHLRHFLDATILSSLLNVVLLALRAPQAKDVRRLCFTNLSLPQQRDPLVKLISVMAYKQGHYNLCKMVKRF